MGVEDVIAGGIHRGLGPRLRGDDGKVDSGNREKVVVGVSWKWVGGLTGRPGEP